MKQLLVSCQYDLILAGFTIILFLILIVYRYRYMRPINSRETSVGDSLSDKEPISVILYVDGRADILSQTLPVLLTQNYPEYEVIVINYGKNNETEDVLKRNSNQYTHLYHTYIPQETRYLSKRKLAFTMGIKAAHFDRLLFVDSKCIPTSTEWLNELSKSGIKQSDILLGNAIYPFSRGIVQKIIAFELLTDNLLYMSQAMSGSFYRGFGEYVSYNKELFLSKQGYKNHLNLKCGENDLFIHENATKNNTQVCLSRESMPQYFEAFTHKEWVKKRFERNTLLQYYKGSKMFTANMEYLFYFLYIVCLIACIVKGIADRSWILPAVSIISFSFLYTYKYILYRKAEKKYGISDIALWLPFLDVVRLYDFVTDKFILLFNKKKSYTCFIKES